MIGDVTKWKQNSCGNSQYCRVTSPPEIYPGLEFVRDVALQVPYTNNFADLVSVPFHYTNRPFLIPVFPPDVGKVFMGLLYSFLAFWGK